MGAQSRLLRAIHLSLAWALWTLTCMADGAIGSLAAAAETAISARGARRTTPTSTPNDSPSSAVTMKRVGLQAKIAAGREAPKLGGSKLTNSPNGTGKSATPGPLSAITCPAPAREHRQGSQTGPSPPRLLRSWLISGLLLVACNATTHNQALALPAFRLSDLHHPSAQ